MNKIIFSIIISLLTINLYASDNFTIPHVFSSGQTISSSQINENFNYLLKFIKDNILVFKFNDQVLGTAKLNLVTSNSNDYMITLNSGYKMSWNPNNSLRSFFFYPLEFSDPACQYPLYKPGEGQEDLIVFENNGDKIYIADLDNGVTEAYWNAFDWDPETQTSIDLGCQLNTHSTGTWYDLIEINPDELGFSNDDVRNNTSLFSFGYLTD